jgi:hypothetical protein
MNCPMVPSLDTRSCNSLQYTTPWWLFRRPVQDALIRAHFYILHGVPVWLYDLLVPPIRQIPNDHIRGPIKQTYPGENIGSSPWGRTWGDLPWGTPSRSPLGGPLVGPELGTLLEDPVWGTPFGDPHVGPPLGDPPWGTLLGDPPCGTSIGDTLVRTPFGNPVVEPPLGTPSFIPLWEPLG